MDVTKNLDLNIAPRVLFNALPERKDKPRFFVRDADKSWKPITWQAFADRGPLIVVLRYVEAERVVEHPVLEAVGRALPS